MKNRNKTMIQSSGKSDARDPPGKTKRTIRNLNIEHFNSMEEDL